ncbi:MAG: hypothetical protein GPI99_19670 [Microcystis aeruginosa W13-15]|nr:hypothetical protein [Microcystis aeruginosa W13-15]
MDIQSKEDEQETRNREKREKYKTIYLNEPFSENKIFRNDKLQTGIIYNGIINNINIKFKKSLYLDLNNFIPFEYANILSFEQKRNYTTEISSTDYDKILTFRTKEGEISFFINNEKIQNCIYDSSFSNLNFSFLKRCHQKSEYYDEFWKSILRNYCRQRKLEFRYSNECDNLLF